MKAKKVGILLISALIIFSTFCSFSAFADSKVNSQTYSKIVSLPVGNGAGMIAYTPDIEDCEKLGPDSFAIAENGDIFILDTVDNEVEEFSSTGKSVNTYKLPEELKDFFDIEVDSNNTFFVLNYLGDILEYKNGSLCSQKKFYFPEEQYTTVGLFKSEENKVIFRNTKTGEEFDVDSNSKKDGYDGFKSTRNGKSLKMVSSNQEITTNYKFTPASTYPVIKTDKDETVILKTEALIGKKIYTESIFEKYQNGNKLCSALAMPIEGNYAYKVPHRYLYCSKNGNAYQLVLQKNSVDIYQLNFDIIDRTNINKALVDEIQPKDIMPVHEPTKGEVSVSSVDRSTAYWNADAMITYSWSFNPTTMKTPSNTTTTCPDHLSGITTTTTVTGVPYCWGGTYGDVSACGKSSFSSMLSGGNTAGNVLCSGNHKSGTAGVDCAGFISVAYRLSQRYNTTGPASLFSRRSSFADSLPGEIFDYAGEHVVMYRYPNFDNNGIIVSYATKESTVGGYGDKAKDYTRSLAELANYLPYYLP